MANEKCLEGMQRKKYSLGALFNTKERRSKNIFLNAFRIGQIKN